MAELVINAEVRNKVGKGAAKKLRAAGLVPAVVYGSGIVPVHCQIKERDMLKIKQLGRNTLVDLVIDGETQTVIVRDFQRNPITHSFVHADFQALDMTETITVFVALEFVGTPIGRKSGGVFTSMLREIQIEAKPNKIPAVIKVDISGLDTGDSLHVSDLKSGDFEVLTDPSIAICQVSAVREEAAEGEGAEGAEAHADASAEAKPAAAKPAADKKEEK